VLTPLVGTLSSSVSGEAAASGTSIALGSTLQGAASASANTVLDTRLFLTSVGTFASAASSATGLLRSLHGTASASANTALDTRLLLSSALTSASANTVLDTRRLLTSVGVSASSAASATRFQEFLRGTASASANTAASLRDFVNRLHGTASGVGYSDANLPTTALMFAAAEGGSESLFDPSLSLDEGVSWGYADSFALLQENKTLSADAFADSRAYADIVWELYVFPSSRGVAESTVYPLSINNSL